MRKFLLALAFVLLGTGTAVHQASAITLTPSPTDFDIETVGPGHFQVAYDFTLSQDSAVKFGGASAFISNFNVGICSTAACPPSDIIKLANTGSFLFLTFALGQQNLAAGTYYLLVAGDASIIGGKYLVGLNAVPLSATTPIPASGLLLLTGIVGLGIYGYRRRAILPPATA
ncbi:MAG TPA: hypothetical protein VHA35_25740 [Dongiaceae bacterium]|jgi:hypothetical protein|nr:hypothetical protein [Dongiaceae bacterium]